MVSYSCRVCPANQIHRVTGSGETGNGAEGERENSQAKGPGHDDTL